MDFACLECHHFESQHVSALSKMLRGRVRVKSWREPAAAEIQGLGNAADVKLLWEGMAGVTTHRHSLLRFSGEKRETFAAWEAVQEESWLSVVALF